MGILGNLTTDESIKEDKDSVGGFSILPSDIYNMTINLAYVSLSASKAMALNVHMTNEKGEKLRQQFYMTSGEAKGCKNYYINARTKEKHYLPGYNLANALCLLTCAKKIHQMDTEKKTINLYDYTEQKEVPTEVDMVMELIGKKILAGVIAQTVDKRAKNTQTGKYEPTGETRQENEIDKLFREKDKLTVIEITARQTEPEFYNKWLKAWQGKTKDKTTKTGVKTGSPTKTQTATPVKQESLFA